MPAQTKVQNPVILLQNVRLSYPSIFSPKPEDNPNKKPKFEATFILDKKIHAAKIAEIQKAIEVAKKSPKLGGKAPSKLLLRDGADTDERAAAEELGPTKMTVSARNTRRPGVVDQQLQPLAEDDGKPYAGCYVNARVEVYPYTFQDGKTTVRGIAGSLINIQFVKDGEPFGAKGGPAEEGFAAIEENADGGSDDGL